LGPSMAPQSQQVILSISSSEEPSLIQAPISTLDEVMETLLRNWRAEREFEVGAGECFEHLVTSRYQVSIFESSPNPNENFFDLNNPKRTASRTTPFHKSPFGQVCQLRLPIHAFANQFQVVVTTI
jgi:hypothetical protein